MPFVKGTSGNPGGRRRGETPRGRFVQQVADAIPEIVAKLVEAALTGDVQAARLILDRVLPPLRPTDEPVKLKLPDDPAERGEAIVEALAAGRLTPSQAATVIDALDGAQALADHGEIARRLEVLETWLRSSDN